MEGVAYGHQTYTFKSTFFTYEVQSPVDLCCGIGHIEIDILGEVSCICFCSTFVIVVS